MILLPLHKKLYSIGIEIPLQCSTLKRGKAAVNDEF